MQQPRPRSKTHIRTCMTAGQRAPHARHISHLHMQITEAYDAHTDLCARLPSEPRLGERYCVTAFLAKPASRPAHDSRNQPSAADRLSDLQYVARLSVTFDTLARKYPGKGEQQPQDANTLTVDNFCAAPPPAPAATATLDEPPARQSSATQPSPRRPPRSQAIRGVFATALETPRAPAVNHLQQPCQLGGCPLGACLQEPSLPQPPLPPPSLGPCFFCGGPSLGGRTCPAYADACQRGPGLPAKCPRCRADGFSPHSCRRRRYLTSVDRNGRSHSSATISRPPLGFRAASSGRSWRASDHRPQLQWPGTSSTFPVTHASAALPSQRLTWPSNLLSRTPVMPPPPPSPSQKPPNLLPAAMLAPLAFRPPTTLPPTQARGQTLADSAAPPSLVRHGLIFAGHSNKLYPLIGHHPRLLSACTVAQDVLPRPRTSAWIRASLPYAPGGPRCRGRPRCQGSTEPSTGCWSARIVMVRKASGARLLCCDYRAINKHVRIPQQPLPHPDDISAWFNGERDFSILDMCQESYQIEVDDRHLGCPRRPTPPTPPTLHRPSRGQPTAAPREVLFGCRTGPLPGHVVSRRGVQPSSSKVKATLDLPPLTNAKAVQRLLDKCYYYRKFIPHFSIGAAPLFQAAARSRDFN
ncbi:hypothetical protein ACSSS7_008420 [Eimeria intestinalis]